MVNVVASGGSSGGGGSSSPISGYEVIRDGQLMSTRQKQPGDIVLKKIIRWKSSGGGGGSSGKSSGGGKISTKDTSSEAARREAERRAQIKPVEAKKIQPVQSQINVTTPLKTPAKLTVEQKKVFARERYERLRRFDFKRGDWVYQDLEGNWNLWGQIGRTGMTVADTAVAVSRADKFFGKSTALSYPVATSTGESAITGLAMFSTFSPAFQTSGQISKAVGTQTEVGFAGTSQQLAKDQVKTDIVYTTSTGEKGIARGVSKVIQGEDKSVVVTAGRGGTYSQRINVPTGSTRVKTGSTFEGAEVSVVKQAGDDFVSVGGGGLRRTGSKDVNQFVSGTVGTSKGDFTSTVGGVITEKGSVRMGGILKTVPKTDAKTFRITGGSQDPALSALVKKNAETSLKNIVTASAEKPPVSVTTPSVSKDIFTPTTVKQTFAPSKTITKVKTKQSTGQIQTPKVKSSGATAQTLKTNVALSTSLATRQGQKQRQEQRPRLSQRSGQTQKQTTRLRLATANPPLVRLKQPKITPTSVSIPTRPPGSFFTPLAPFSLKSKRQRSNPFKRTTRGFKQPRRTPSLLAVGRNIKSPTKGIAEFSGITLRPILTKKKKKKVKGGKR